MDVKAYQSITDAAQYVADSEYVTIYVYAYQSRYGNGRIYWLTTAPVNNPRVELIATCLAQSSEPSDND